MKHIILTAVISSALTLGVVHLAGAKNNGYAEKVVMDNARVEVTDRVMEVGGFRDTHVRATDQVIVFLDESSYDRVDAKTGAVTRQTRKAGEVLWHFKGENAPKLINRGGKPMRSLLIALK